MTAINKIISAQADTFDKEKWIAVVGLYEGHPYEIFSGKAENFALPSTIDKGWVIRVKEGSMPARYDFQFLDQDGYKVTIEGLSRMFKKEYWNYAKLISGILRHGMPIQNVIELVSKLTLDTDTINTWKNGIARALKRYVKDGTIVESTYTNETANAVAENDGVAIEFEMLTADKPVALSEELAKKAEAICEAEGIDYLHMNSGAGHDAMHMAKLAPTTMIFIPCKEGISHNPAEFAKLEDICRAVEVLAKLLESEANE